MRHADKTHCVRGHPFSGDNLKLEWTDRHHTRKMRVCVTCNRMRRRVGQRMNMTIKTVYVETPDQQTLRVQIEELQETVRQLREMLTPPVGFIRLGLTGTERMVLATLYARPGHIFPRERLADLLDYECEIKNFDVFISRIRKKLPEGIEIITVRGSGWSIGRDDAEKLKPFE